MSRSAIVMVGKSQIGKCLDRQLANQQMTHQQKGGKCLGQQMSWSAFVRSANVGRETSACKCLVGKRRFTVINTTLAVIDTTLITHLNLPMPTRRLHTHTHTSKCYVAQSVSRQDETRQDKTQKTCGALLDSACGCCKKSMIFFPCGESTYEVVHI